MNIKKAVDHFVFKLTKVWKATDKDAEAINEIMKFVQDKSNQQFQDYHLFAKLYVMVYAQFLDKYNATVFDDIPIKELTRYLDIPLEKIIERFTDKLNESELYGLFDELNVCQDHPALQSDSVKKNEINVLSDAIKDDNKLKQFNRDVWDYQTVKDNLEAQINNTINLLG